MAHSAFDIDTSKPIEKMTDAELAKVAKLAELIGKAKAEQERRATEKDTNVAVVPVAMPRVVRTTTAPCPSCGKRDAAIDSRTLYADGELARHEAIGTAAYCGNCRIWYDAKTGKLADMRYTY